MLQLCIGFIPAICLNAIVKLRVADHLAAGPQHVHDIARTVGANEDALYRVMRALETVGVFRETGNRRFEQTPMSDLLRSDHPQSLRPFVEFFPDPLHFRCYANLMHAVRTGQATPQMTLGGSLFEYYATHPEDLAVFNAAMVNLTHVFIPAILDAYDFSEIRTLVDVGGGHGSVLASILQKYPAMNGVLFDLDHVLHSAGAYLHAAGVSERCKRVGGDFFRSVPPGGDAYIMKNIIHDWDDEKCVTILRNVKTALDGQPRGKVLLLEFVLTPGGDPGDLQLGKWADIEMLVLPGGRERTEEEFRSLFARSGFRLTRIIPTKSPQSVIEAECV